MLIQRLVEHARTTDSIPANYRNRHVRWAIVIDDTGKAAIIDRANADNKAGSQIPAPYLTRTSGVAAMLLADTAEYVFGIAKDDSDKALAGADRRSGAFLALLEAWRETTDDPIAATICDLFTTERHLDLVAGMPDAKPSDLVAIFIAGQWAHLRPSAISYWGRVARERKSSGTDGLCLACGTTGPLLNTVPDMVKSSLIPVGVDAKGRPKRGRDAALISVNTTAQGRGGTLQLVNTPLCEECGGRAMAGLNHLLSDERHRRRGDDNVITWWLRHPTDFDPMIIERPDLKTVNALLSEVYQPQSATAVDDNDFYALTLSANQSRIVVRDWIEQPLTEIKKHYAAWFNDHASTEPWSDGVHYVPLRVMVRAGGRWDRTKKQYVPGSVPHGLERDLLRAAMRGTPPPPALVPQLLHRIRNDHRVDLPRVAMLRLALIRPPYKEAIMPGLDQEATEPAYVWGRMFAVLESLQRRALPDVNATIRDRYFGLAMTRPASTMGMLRTNANGHIKKLMRKEESRGAARALDGRLADLSSLLDQRTGLPGHLDTRGQIKFILGYDHQRSADMAAARAAKEAKRIAEADGTDLSEN